MQKKKERQYVFGRKGMLPQTEDKNIKLSSSFFYKLSYKLREELLFFIE